MFTLRLQRFAGEKTERATPKRRDDARRKGNVSKSPELTSAIVLAAVMVVLKFSAPLIWTSWQHLLQTDLTMQPPTNWTTTTVTELLLLQIANGMKVLIPVLIAGLVIGIAVAVMQVKPMFVLALLAPKFSRIGPLSGLKKLFGMHSLVELSKSMLKLIIIGFVSYSTIAQLARQIQDYSQMQLVQLPSVIGSMVFNLGLRIAAMMVVLAFFDFLYQRFEYEKGLKMTKQEVKDEMKQMEGNPEVKSAIRRRARQIAFRRMMEDVPKADVVVTNPTHFAIALKYDAATMNAPRVVAKGADLLAQRLKTRAAEANVPMVENRPLAQALYKNADVGDAVPADLYQAVAEVLAYVYKLKQVSRR